MNIKPRFKHLALLLFTIFALTACFLPNSQMVRLFQAEPNNVGGNPEGEVTLVEFMDYLCRTCRTMAPVIEQVIANEPQLRVVYREYPVRSPNSSYVARAAIAAQLQDKYLGFKTLLMNSTQQLTKQHVMALAKQAQLDMEQLRQDMDSDYVNDMLENNRELAKLWDVLGVPTYIIGHSDGQGDTIMLSGLVKVQQFERAIAELQQ